MLKRFHSEIEFWERWLKEPDGEVKLAEPNPEEITVTMHDRDEMFIELNECYNFSDNDVSVGTETPTLIDMISNSKKLSRNYLALG